MCGFYNIFYLHFVNFPFFVFLHLISFFIKMHDTVANFDTCCCNKPNCPKFQEFKRLEYDAQLAAGIVY